MYTHTKNKELYISVNFETNTEMGMDILKVSKGSSQAVKVGSIGIPKDTKIGFGNFNIARFLPNDNIFLGFRIDYKVGDIKTLISYYLG